MSTIAEKWREEGHKEGKDEGIRNTLEKLIQARFGTISEDVMVLIASYKLEQVDTLINLALESGSVDEFVVKATQLNSE